ncbi:hypothetical protein, conserved [Trypanosoma brucei brucei TREU927]|uniref:Uncharacterized protein n=1 Tax=Trypanosoma brucei brucei (strain 927/4 GUTat10.1) TaxID=185431 RepID=Q38FT4_TRYB2|nr:hypothetical protein, conserved [Trypanosoma brucei brucei TREU927]EAN76336.1 hypothetical protein, conserved [Trypanosoma brucei brucei TREU927]
MPFLFVFFFAESIPFTQSATYGGELAPMGRSNNQLRRTAKERGKPFIPKKRKSKTYNQIRSMKIKESRSTPRKLSYRNVITKKGGVTKRKFRPGGYNSSGKFGKAAGAKENARKGSLSGTKKGGKR